MESGIKITAGIGSVDDYISLVKSGTDEVFCGFVPYEWNEKFGNMQPLNRREVLFYHVQIGSYSEMKILRKMQEKYGIPVAVTFNALYYTKEQIICILSIMKKLMEIGFRDFIVCDVALLLRIKEEKLNCNIHISGEIGEWNRNTLEVFRELIEDDAEISFAGQKGPRLKRIIFHRKNTLQDMASIIKYGKKVCPELEYEAFFLNEMCHFTGGYCNSLHCDEMVHMCQMPYKLAAKKKQKFTSDLILENWENRWEQDWFSEEEEIVCEEEMIEVPGESGCGFCALWKLKELGITHLKIVGRGKSVVCMEKDVENVKKGIGLLEKSVSEEAYMRDMKEMLFTGKCSENCYYRDTAM